MDHQISKINKDTLRTVLANERTMLAYIRTALSAIIFGMAILKFFYEFRFLIVLSWVAIIGGIFVFGWGIFQYGVRNRVIHRLNE